MAKQIEQISPTSWSITEEIGPTTTKYMVYDDDPNVNKFTTDLRKLSVSDINSIKESLNIGSGIEGPAGATGATGATGPEGGGGVSSADAMLSAFELAAQDRKFAEKFQFFINMIMGS